MLVKSYLINYLNTYFWKGISITLNMVSMFIVLPYLTSNKPIYGIYSLCISFAIYLSYADLGFLSSGIKFAGEAYANGDRDKELTYYGFSSFVLFLFVTLISFTFLLLSFYPEYLIKGLSDINQKNIASKLLLIQALFSITIVIQRYGSAFFQVRIEEYVVQRIAIFANIVKILSVYYFFEIESYNIVGYFIFTKTIDLLASLGGIFPGYKHSDFVHPAFKAIRKINFIQSLDSHLQKNVIFKPYHYYEYQFNEVNYIKSKIPSLEILAGNLQSEMKLCSLVVMDHHSTTLNIAMAINVPIILFWNKKQHQFKKTPSMIIKLMREKGIIFSNYKEAAEHINENFNTINKWWFSKEIQKIRNKYCQEMARNHKDWKKIFVYEINKIIASNNNMYFN